ncbi:MAG: ABC transporter permease [Hyphomicrobiales bacterium]|nr:ABC transporter permease [Hyphomicrobiales bacterium]
MTALALRRPMRAPGLLAMLAIMLVGFSIASRDFTTAGNALNVLLQSSVLLLIALPMTFVILTEGLDLSIGAVLSLCSVTLAQTALATQSLAAALAVALAVGTLAGLLNGSLVAYLRIPPFVATLGTLGVAQSLALIATGGQSVVGLPDSLVFVYGGSILGIRVPILLVVVAYVLMHALLYRTRFGSYVFALGGNREALTLAGVPWRRMLLGVYALAGAWAGVAGLLMASRLNAGHPTAGIGMEFDAIAAVALGGTSFERGNGWLPGTLLGALTIGILRNGLNLLAVPSALQVGCIGLLVIVAFTLEAFRTQTP